MVVFIWGLATRDRVPKPPGGGGDAARLICIALRPKVLLLPNTSPPPRPLTDFFSYGAANNKGKQKQTNKELTNFNECRRAAVAGCRSFILVTRNFSVSGKYFSSAVILESDTNISQLE